MAAAPSQTWIVFDTQRNRKAATICHVAPSVVLKGVTLTNGSATMTFTALTDDKVFPGMLLMGKGIPDGTRVLTVDGDTTLTMSAAASAAGSGLWVMCRSYLPYKEDGTIDTKNVHLEHYRDYVTGTSSMSLVAQRGDYLTVVGPWVSGSGVSIYPDEGTVQVESAQATTGNYTPALHGTMKVGISDPVKHIPPREQTQVVSFVHFILDDGNLCPVTRYPGYDIVPAK